MVKLTPHEQRICKVFVETCDHDKELAKRFGMKHGAMRMAMFRIMEKVGARNRVELFCFLQGPVKIQ